MITADLLNAAVTGTLVVSLYFAGNALSQTHSSVRDPDADRGRVIAAQGTASGAPACAQCHAFNGASDGSGAFPRIGAQSDDYLKSQMHDFASGVRSNAIMSPIAKSLTPEEINDVAAYYAEVKAPFPPLKSENPVVIKIGEQLATVGDPSNGIPACDACHGPKGNGALGIAPYLGGQYAHYIAFTLHMWQRGYRKNSSDVMEPFAKKLDDRQIAAVAAYYQQVYAPAVSTANK